MIQVQLVLNFVEGNNHIQLNMLEREDANDLEREMAQHIQSLYVSILEDLRDQLPAGEVELTLISVPPVADSGDTIIGAGKDGGL